MFHAARQPRIPSAGIDTPLLLPITFAALQELLGFMDLGTNDPKPLPAGLTHLSLSLGADFWEAGPPEEASAT